MEDMYEPITVTPIDEEEDEVNSSFSASYVRAPTKLSMLMDLPKFEILSDDMKYTSGVFETFNQYFKAFERTFRIQNVELAHNWKYNLANVVGINHVDWYADTIEASTSSLEVQTQNFPFLSINNKRIHNHE
ncbi:hypothetical protein INT46_005399 [Mucor plumbeus]|uniref:Uncharacterized protein n=1 Tax=Mucor plumbeus TaxID=97098 RepID=A0A8H7V272_9FUNG|nr:hypothetical protein INT46_005399 [Mucor plumbeus]